MEKLHKLSVNPVEHKLFIFRDKIPLTEVDSVVGIMCWNKSANDILSAVV
jgi:predicted nuclease of restriction endonuclease-like RecB superfamily